MTDERTSRSVLAGGLAAGPSVAGAPGSSVQGLAPGETVVPFTDVPEKIPLSGSPERRIIDVRTITDVLTPKDQFFTTQHHGHPQTDPASFRLKVTGLVDRPKALSLEELRAMPSADVVFGFECSGNRRPVQGSCSNGRWTGVPLRAVLEQAGVRSQAREFVFFAADHAEEDVEFRTQTFKVDQHYGRSLTREQALSTEPLLAYAMNGEPLTRHQGSPLRLLVPGWYGCCNVKWLSQIHAQEDLYLGKYQARWYRTLRGVTIDGELKWMEAAITHMNPKSFIARVTFDGVRHKVFGIVLHDGTPINSVEVRVDDGPWQPATLDPATRDKFSWKFFTYIWNGATPGEHTLTSRVTDVNGRVQRTPEELELKKTSLEDDAQFRRTLTIT